MAGSFVDAAVPRHSVAPPLLANVIESSGRDRAVYDVVRTIGIGSFGRAVLVQKRGEEGGGEEAGPGGHGSGPADGRPAARPAAAGPRLYVVKKIDVSRLRRKEKECAVNEIRLLSGIRHPFIVGYKAWFFDRVDGNLCIAMEYADGGDLFRTIARQRKLRDEIVGRGGGGGIAGGGGGFAAHPFPANTPVPSSPAVVASSAGYFPERQIVRWFTQAALALKYLHEKHILHRDLKTQNLFLTASGKIKLGDFGIAKALDGTAAFAETQIGTPFYLSPEICKNKPYSWAADIWALGCILYEMATLETPFNAPNLTQLIEKITKRPPPALPATFSPALRRLCAACLSRDPTQRPTAADLLMTDLCQREIAAMVDEVRRRQQLPEGLPAANVPMEPGGARLDDGFAASRAGTGDRPFAAAGAAGFGAPSYPRVTPRLAPATPQRRGRPGEVSSAGKRRCSTGGCGGGCGSSCSTQSTAAGAADGGGQRNNASDPGPLATPARRRPPADDFDLFCTPAELQASAGRPAGRGAADPRHRSTANPFRENGVGRCGPRRGAHPSVTPPIVSQRSAVSAPLSITPLPRPARSPQLAAPPPSAQKGQVLLPRVRFQWLRRKLRPKSQAVRSSC